MATRARAGACKTAVACVPRPRPATSFHKTTRSGRQAPPYARAASCYSYWLPPPRSSSNPALRSPPPSPPLPPPRRWPRPRPPLRRRSGPSTIGSLTSRRCSRSSGRNPGCGPRRWRRRQRLQRPGPSTPASACSAWADEPAFPHLAHPPEPGHVHDTSAPCPTGDAFLVGVRASTGTVDAVSPASHPSFSYTMPLKDASVKLHWADSGRVPLPLDRTAQGERSREVAER